jgi:hypothetical protein
MVVGSSASVRPCMSGRYQPLFVGFGRVVTSLGELMVSVVAAGVKVTFVSPTGVSSLLSLMFAPPGLACVTAPVGYGVRCRW